jgi:hypothetical protein
MNKTLFLWLSLMSFASWGEDCTFDADDADRPGFANRMTKCQTLQEQQAEISKETSHGDRKAAILLYGDGTVDPESGIAERPVVAPGTLNHTAAAVYAVREAYSLRANARFEESITLAIHRLHAQMAQHCSQGWLIEQEWVKPNPTTPGDFYLHYRFRCDS